MVIPEKSKFMQEVDALNNPNIKDNLMQLYNHLMGYEKIKNVNAVIKDVLRDMFNLSNLTTEILIPYKFLNTSIGKVIFLIMFSMDDNTYTVSELLEFTKTPDNPKGLTKQYINQELREGNINGTKKGNRWVFTESDVNSWLLRKGYKPIDDR